MGLFSNWFKKKKKYKASNFSKSRTHQGQTQYYHDQSNEWLYLYLILSDFDDCAGPLSYRSDDSHSYRSDDSHSYRSDDSHSQPADYETSGIDSLSSTLDNHSSFIDSSPSHQSSVDSYSPSSSFSSSSDSGSSYSGGSDF